MTILNLDAEISRLLARIAQLETDLQTTRTNANHWKQRFLLAQNSVPSALSLTFELPREILDDLHREATMRGCTSNALARRIVETATRDKLFTAVLDQ